MPDRIHFLSGLPRSGSTLLGSLLAQNPAVHVTPTSPLAMLLVNAAKGMPLIAQYTCDHKRISERIYDAIVGAVYEDIQEPIVFDKNRFWPGSVEELRRLSPQPKIVATVRPTAEVVASYITLCEQNPANNFIDQHIRRDGQEINHTNRADLIWNCYLKEHYDVLVGGLTTHREHILLVPYDELVRFPHETLNEIHTHCELPDWHYDYSRIADETREKDAGWGMPGLHSLRPTLGKVSVNPRCYLAEDALEFFTNLDERLLWHEPSLH